MYLALLVGLMANQYMPQGELFSDAPEIRVDVGLSAPRIGGALLASFILYLLAERKGDLARGPLGRMLRATFLLGYFGMDVVNKLT